MCPLDNPGQEEVAVPILQSLVATSEVDPKVAEQHFWVPVTPDLSGVSSQFFAV